MTVLVLPILLVAWLEASWSGWAAIGGIHIPLTLLVIFLLQYRGWVDIWQAMVLAGLGVYLLDWLAALRPGQVVAGMVVAAGLSGWLLGLSQNRWQRWGSLAAALLVFEVIMMAFGGWPDPAAALSQLALFVGLSLFVFALIRWMSKRVEAWL